jgi:hypothetical protein
MKNCVIIICAILLVCAMIPCINAHQGTPVNVPPGKKPVIDGKMTSGEWADAAVVTMVGTGGSGGLYFKHDTKYLYIAIEFKSDDPLPDVAIDIPFDPDHDGSSTLQSDDIKFGLGYSGVQWIRAEWKVANGSWQMVTSGADWQANGTLQASTNVFAEFCIPLKRFSITPGINKTIGCAVFITKDPGIELQKWPVNQSDINTPNSWGDLTGKWIPEFSTVIVAVVAVPIILYAVRYTRRL